MTRVWRRIPDFAGIALVDILANSVGMLIIVIVLSIAARMDRDERYSAQTSEVAAVMSHKFSTSLVLHQLATSERATLHDYVKSPREEHYGTERMPVLEFHRGYVREHYCGKEWSRDDLLSRNSDLGASLARLSDQQKRNIRVDLHDISEYYVAMSLLRRHGIRIRHFHWIGPSPIVARPRPAPAACAWTKTGTPQVRPPKIPREEGRGLAYLTKSAPGGGTPVYPRPESPGRQGAGDGTVPAPGPLPDGVALGATREEEMGLVRDESARNPLAQSEEKDGSAARIDREPRTDGDVRDPPEASRGLTESPRAPSETPPEVGSRGDEHQMPLRVGLPGWVGDEISRASRTPDGRSLPLEEVFRVVIHYLGEIQDAVDAGRSASVHDYRRWLSRALAPPHLRADDAPQVARVLPEDEALRIRSKSEEELKELDRQERSIARRLTGELVRVHDLHGSEARPGSLLVFREPDGTVNDAELIFETNLSIERVGVVGRTDAAAVALGEPKNVHPPRARVTIGLNGWPELWEGPRIEVERYSAILAPPRVTDAHRVRWRAVAYVSPRLDDLVVGFVMAGVDGEQRLRVQADASRVRLGDRPVRTAYREPWFGAGGWLMTLYAGLAVGFLLMVILWRFLARRVV